MAPPICFKLPGPSRRWRAFQPNQASSQMRMEVGHRQRVEKSTAGGRDAGGWAGAVRSGHPSDLGGTDTQGNLRVCGHRGPPFSAAPLV